VSVVASSETSNVPPGDLPRAADSSLEQAPSTNNVAAAPVTPVRNSRREMPRRRALSSASRCVRRMTSRRNGLCGTGWNSPFDTGPNLIGSQCPSAAKPLPGPPIAPIYDGVPNIWVQYQPSVLSPTPMTV
jgi:hypothetical protein